MRDHESELVNYQWGSGALINNTDYYISGIDPPKKGIMTKKFCGERYYTYPEYGIYLGQ